MFIYIKLFIIPFILVLTYKTKPAGYKTSKPLVGTCSVLLFLLLTNHISMMGYLLVNSLLFLFTYFFQKTKVNGLIFYLIHFYGALFLTAFFFSMLEVLSQRNIYLFMEQDPLLIYLLIACSTLCLLITSYDVKNRIKPNHWDFIFKTNSVPFLFILLLLLLTKKVAFLFMMLYTKHSFEISLTLFLALTIEFIFVGAYLHSNIKSYDLSIYKYEQRILKLQYDIRATYYEQLESHQMHLRKVAHDLHHHKLVLSHYIEHQKYEKAKAYLNDYSLHLEKHQTVQFCAHPVLNALLLKTHNQCLQHNIAFKADIKLPTTLPITDFDLCILIGNLLDNAVEACCKIETQPRFMTISAQEINQNYTFKILNTYMQPQTVKFNFFQTTKEDSLSHGLGLSNVERVINQNNGMIDYQIQDQQFSVIFCIPTA